MIHKNRCNRRHIREKNIKRKANILNFKECLSWIGNKDNYIFGKLSKGKIHCSCGLCNNKSFKIVVNRHSYPYHGTNNLSRRDKRALDIDKFEELELEE